MVGRPPLPTNVKLLRGNPGQRKIRPEPQPTQIEYLKEPPAFLMPYAADEWRRVVPELQRMRLLTVVDVACLAAYCQAYAVWVTADETLEKMSRGDNIAHGLLVKHPTNGGTMRNPLLRIAQDARAEVVRYASEFGFTPVARVRLAGAGNSEAPPGKFHGLLA